MTKKYLGLQAAQQRQSSLERVTTSSRWNSRISAGNQKRAVDVEETLVVGLPPPHHHHHHTHTHTHTLPPIGTFKHACKVLNRCAFLFVLHLPSTTSNVVKCMWCGSSGPLFCSGCSRSQSYSLIPVATICSNQNHSSAPDSGALATSLPQHNHPSETIQNMSWVVAANFACHVEGCGTEGGAPAAAAAAPGTAESVVGRVAVALLCFHGPYSYDVIVIEASASALKLNTRGYDSYHRKRMCSLQIGAISGGHTQAGW